jgi:uncharacterized protein (DUF2267 family)
MRLKDLFRRNSQNENFSNNENGTIRNGRIDENRFRTAAAEQAQQRKRGNNRRHAMDFEQYASEGNRFIHEVAYELYSDRNKAARVLRAVLHAIRDRLPADDAIQFAQGLPMALKGIFIDQYDISKTPVVIRNPEKFLDFIYQKNGISAQRDFPDRESVVDALQAVFFVLSNHMDYGQVEHIKRMLNKELVMLIESFD